MSKGSISQIANRTNIQHKVTDINDVVIYEDHRYILNVINFVHKKRKIEGSFDIILFDRHDDFCPPSKETLNQIQNYLKEPSPESLNRIVEFNLNPLDDDWIKAGMQLGLINNVFLFNSTESSIVDYVEYDTNLFGKKRMYNVGNIWDALGHRGKLNDFTKYGESDLTIDFGFTFKEYKYFFNKEGRRFIFDIDLDCFSHKLLDHTLAIPEELLNQKFQDRISNAWHTYFCPLDFLSEIARSSEFVTICIESECCGGIRQSQKIFNYVDNILFDGQLGQ